MRFLHVVTRLGIAIASVVGFAVVGIVAQTPGAGAAGETVAFSYNGTTVATPRFTG
jgi:hypothetical protein